MDDVRILSTGRAKEPVFVLQIFIACRACMDAISTNHMTHLTLKYKSPVKS